MKILVTGANGYLGRGIVKQLLDNGHQVIATDLNMDLSDSRLTLKECNIFDVEAPFEFFERPEVLLHLALRNGFIHNSDSHIMDLPKHYSFIKSMVSSGVSKVAVMGTMHEIGFYEGSINENTPCHPLNLYGISKDALRNMVQLLAANENTLFQWLRGYYIVGNSKFGNSIFSKITEAEKEGKTKFPFTLGQNQYDFIDYDEFCFQVAAAVGQSEINGIINIASGKPEKLSDRVEKFIKANNYSIKLSYGEFPDRPYDSKAVWADNTKIQNIIQNNNFML